MLGMAPEEECESEIFVRLRWGGRRMAVPLSQLEPLTADLKPRRRSLTGITGWAGAISSKLSIRYKQIERSRRPR